ncbi:hypothetical protein ACFW5D_37380 [Streptomyces sp. NPDC058770]|uniref:hypothetical protein n=1 Tax=Streptomyces sp. NPDC058770 TaxID=3346631 RepID=UPI0036943315
MQVPDDLGTSTPTVLRVFRNLMKRTSRPRTEVVDALMHYLPTAVSVGYVNDDPDIDLPLPGPDYADQIGVLLAAAGSMTGSARTGRRCSGPPFKTRQGHRTDPTGGEHACCREGTEEAVRECR